ncbi:PH domain containing protein [Entamoeba histolytica HM-3:IMSS]|uniref:PH domain containing protein n=1 Tax=Entamoeba histolytica HM-3:IMSS TaxID=885315 RepID=M7WBA2_ENTHI|nr:PH domain containing protein [Entamoeba histolytica HM-3:IMSS]
MAENEELNVSVMQLQPSIFEAWAKKQGGSVKNWKKRWFVLKPTRLWYFKAKNSTSAQGYIELTPQTTIQEETGMNVPGKKFFFSIDSRNQKGTRKFIFCVDNEVYLREFLKRIFDAIHAQQQLNLPKTTSVVQKVEEIQLAPINVGGSQPSSLNTTQNLNNSIQSNTSIQQSNLQQNNQLISSSQEKSTQSPLLDKPQTQAPKPQKKAGWVVTRPTISHGSITQTQSSGDNTSLQNGNEENKMQVQQELEDIRRVEEEKRMEKFRQQQEEYMRIQQEEEKKRIEEEIQRQMEEQQKEEEQKIRDQQEMIRQQEELLKQQELQQQLEEEERKKKELEEQEKMKQMNVIIDENNKKENSSSSTSDYDDGEDTTLQNVISFVQAFEWIRENAQEFVQLFYDNIPRRSPTHLSASVNPTGTEIFLRCTSPLSELRTVIEFFNQVGSPEEQIEKMKTEAGRNGVLAIESWISLSDKGGCDAGWNIIAEQDSLDVIQDISDPSEIDSVGIIKLWCETNHVDYVHRFGRDMGDQPPYNTEFWMDIPSNEIEMIQNAATAFMFPEIPKEVLDSCLGSRVMVKVVTSEDGFVKFSVIIEKIQEQNIKNCIELLKEDPTDVLNLQQLLNIKIEGFEYTFLNEGFGYDVYNEGAKTSVVFRMGSF